MFRGRCSCTISLLVYPARPELRGERAPRRVPTFPSTTFSPYHFLYRFRPSFNCRVFSHFPNSYQFPYRSVFALSSFLSIAWRAVPKNRGRGEGWTVFVATRHPSLVRRPKSNCSRTYANPRGRGVAYEAQPSNNTVDLSIHSVNVDAP